MLDILKRLFQNSQDDPGIDRQKILYNLQKLQREHSFVDVHFPTRNDKHYQSMILDVSPDKNRVTIDELYPKNQVGRVHVGDVIEITSRTKGIKLGFFSKIEKVRLSDGELSYDIELPEQIKEKQKRNNFRVNIPLDSGVKLYIYDESDLMCSVLNLSSQGIGFYIAGNYSNELDKKTQLTDCVIELPDQTAVTCSIDVRSIEFKSRPNRRTIVGGRLSQISPPQQKKLDQYVAVLQRLQRQQELRLR